MTDHSSTSVDASKRDDTIEFLDILAFVWSVKIFLLAGILLGSIAGLAVAHVKKKVIYYSSDVEMIIQIPFDLAPYAGKSMSAWASYLSTPKGAKAISDTLEKHDVAFGQSVDQLEKSQQGKNTLIGKMVEIKSGSTHNSLLLALHTPGQISDSQAFGIAKDILLSTFNNSQYPLLNHEPQQKGAAAQADRYEAYPSIDYMKLEYDLFRKMKRAHSDGQDYLKFFNQSGQISYDNLLRMLMVLFDEKLISEDELKTMLVKVSLLSQKVNQKDYFVEYSFYEALQSLSGVSIKQKNIISASQPVTTGPSRQNALLLGLSIGGSLGFFLAAIVRFIQLNRGRIKYIFAKNTFG